MSCSPTLSYPTVSVFLDMARFSAKGSSMDNFPRRARQRRTGPSRSSSHHFFTKVKPTQMATPRRSRLSFIYVGNVSVQCSSCSMHRLTFLNSSVLMLKTRTSKSYLGQVVPSQRSTSVAASVLGLYLGALVNTPCTPRCYSLAWKQRRKRWP